MRLPIFPLVITKESFQQWSDELAQQGRLFNFEDDPAEIIDSQMYTALFTPSECWELKSFLKSAFASDFDPMECAVKSLDIYN